MSSSSATCEGESGDEVPKMIDEQPPPKKVLVKGASTGWIKAKGFLKNLASSGDSASSQNSKSDIPPSPTLSASFFSTLSPEMCVDLLRHSSPKIYKNIRRRISIADNDWMEAFFHANGLNVLFEMLAELTDSTKFCDSSSLNNVILPMYCVECVKSIMKNNHNMELIVGQPEYVYKLVQAIGSEKFAVRSNAVQLLSALAYFSEQGCQVILDGLMRFQQKSSKKFWTEILVDELSQNSADIDYKASLMALINCIMFNVHVDKRSKIRNEFLAVGLKDLLANLREQASSSASERLTVQLNLFHEYWQKDQQRLEPKVVSKIGNDINVNDHYELFAVLMQRVGNRPYSASLLTILQSLSLLDLEVKCCYQQWDLIEQFIAAVCSMDSSQKDLPEFLNYLQQILTNLLCKSVKNVETQTSNLDEILENVRDQKNKAEFQNGEHGPKKRRGFKKKFSNFWNFTGKNSAAAAAAADESSKKVSSKKKRVNYKLKSGSNNARRLSSSKKYLKAKIETDERWVQKIDAKESTTRIGKYGPKSSTKTPLTKMRRNSLTSLIDDRQQKSCALLSCKKLSAPPPAPTANADDFTDTLLATASSAFVTAADNVDSTSPTAALASESSTAAATVAHAPPPAPPPPPPPVFLADRNFAAAPSAEMEKKTPTVPPRPPPFFLAAERKPAPCIGQPCRPIIPAPSAMLTTLSPRGAPRAPLLPPPLSSTPAPPAPPPPSASLNNVLGSRTTTGAPAPPPLLLLQRQTAVVSGNEPPPSVENVNAHFYTFPKEKCKKTKMLYWNKLAPASLAQKKNNVWVENVNVSMDSVNLTKIEELFHCETQPSTSNGKKAAVERTASSSNDLNSDQTATAPNAGASKIFEEVYILDQKTSLKISLFLKQFRGLSLEQIVDLAVNNSKGAGNPTSGGGGARPPEEQMSLERLRGLQKCLVGAEQYIVDVQNYDGDYAKLGMAEKFVWHIGQHKFFSLRLDVKCLQREFDEKCKNFANSFDTLIDCCRKLRSSQSLKYFLFLVLRVGNYLNLGSSSGPAAGFKISSIKQLNALKATGRSSTTLLHVLVESAENDDNAAAAGDKKPLEFTSQLSDVHSAAKIDYEATKTDLTAWAAETRKLIQTVRTSTDPQFVQENESFLKLVDESLKELTVEKVRQVETSAKTLQEYFCDDLKLTELLNLFSEFLRNVERAKLDNEQRKMKEERLAKQKELQELKKATAGQSGTIKRSGSSSNNIGGSRDSLVENLLAKIREGDIAPRSTTKDYSSPFEGFQGLRRSRHFVRTVMNDQSRERFGEQR